MTDAPKIKVSLNGPYLVQGSLPLLEQSTVNDQKGQSIDWKVTRTFPEKAAYALCRCGHSKSKPYCDGTHAKIGFDGTETASQASYEESAKLFRGPRLSLADEESLCAFARFCDPNGQVWGQVEATDDPAVARTFVAQTNKCSSGRLVPIDNATGKALEEKRPQQVSITQDSELKLSGPIWVEGGVSIESASGHTYEVRNRVTLCRCGQSQNKPFCDGTHASIKFSDKD